MDCSYSRNNTRDLKCKVNFNSIDMIEYDDIANNLRTNDYIKRADLRSEIANHVYPKFKIGDKVEILGRIGGERNYCPIYTNDMLRYAGTITTIINITVTGSLILDNIDYFWDKKAVKLLGCSDTTNNKKDSNFKEKVQELNLFPTRKHYQLNFN